MESNVIPSLRARGNEEEVEKNVCHHFLVCGFVRLSVWHGREGGRGGGSGGTVRTVVALRRRRHVHAAALTSKTSVTFRLRSPSSSVLVVVCGEGH